MRPKIPVLVAALFLTPSIALAGDWESLQPGLAHRTLEAAAPAESGKNPVIQLFRIDQKKNHLRPIVAAKGSILSAGDARRLTGALLAVNANFFDETNNILGLVIKNGHTLYPLRKVSWWAVFFQTGNDVRIVHSSSYAVGPQIVNAIEAGPRLVVDGVLPRLKKGFSRKSAIGINRRGDVLIAVSSSPIETEQFAEILALPERKGGAGCLHALNLDGGGSTQLSAEIGSFKLNVSGFSGVPVLLGVFGK